MKRTQYFTRKERIGIWRIKNGIPQYFSASSEGRAMWGWSLYSVEELLSGPTQRTVMGSTGHGIFATTRDDARKVCPKAFHKV